MKANGAKQQGPTTVATATASNSTTTTISNSTKESKMKKKRGLSIMTGEEETELGIQARYSSLTPTEKHVIGVLKDLLPNEAPSPTNCANLSLTPKASLMTPPPAMSLAQMHSAVTKTVSASGTGTGTVGSFTSDSSASASPPAKRTKLNEPTLNTASPTAGIVENNTPTPMASSSSSNKSAETKNTRKATPSNKKTKGKKPQLRLDTSAESDSFGIDALLSSDLVSPSRYSPSNGAGFNTGSFPISPTASSLISVLTSQNTPTNVNISNGQLQMYQNGTSTSTNGNAQNGTGLGNLSFSLMTPLGGVGNGGLTAFPFSLPNSPVSASTQVPGSSLTAASILGRQYSPTSISPKKEGSNNDNQRAFNEQQQLQQQQQQQQQQQRRKDLSVDPNSEVLSSIFANNLMSPFGAQLNHQGAFMGQQHLFPPPGSQTNNMYTADLNNNSANGGIRGFSKPNGVVSAAQTTKAKRGPKKVNKTPGPKKGVPRKAQLGKNGRPRQYTMLRKRSECHFCAEIGTNCGLVAGKCPNRPCNNCGGRHRHGRCRLKRPKPAHKAGPTVPALKPKLA